MNAWLSIDQPEYDQAEPWDAIAVAADAERQRQAIQGMRVLESWGTSGAFGAPESGVQTPMGFDPIAIAQAGAEPMGGPTQIEGIDGDLSRSTFMGVPARARAGADVIRNIDPNAIDPNAYETYGGAGPAAGTISPLGVNENLPFTASNEIGPLADLRNAARPVFGDIAAAPANLGAAVTGATGLPEAQENYRRAAEAHRGVGEFAADVAIPTDPLGAALTVAPGVAGAARGVRAGEPLARALVRGGLEAFAFDPTNPAAANPLARAFAPEVVAEPRVIRLAVQPGALNDLPANSMAAALGSKTIGDPSAVRVLAPDEALMPGEIEMFTGRASPANDVRAGTFVTPDPRQAESYARSDAALTSRPAGIGRRILAEERGSVSFGETNPQFRAPATAQGGAGTPRQPNRVEQLEEAQRAEMGALPKATRATPEAAVTRQELAVRQAEELGHLAGQNGLSVEELQMLKNRFDTITDAEQEAAWWRGRDRASAENAASRSTQGGTGPTSPQAPAPPSGIDYRNKPLSPEQSAEVESYRLRYEEDTANTRRIIREEMGKAPPPPDTAGKPPASISDELDTWRASLEAEKGKAAPKPKEPQRSVKPPAKRQPEYDYQKQERPFDFRKQAEEDAKAREDLAERLRRTIRGEPTGTPEAYDVSEGALKQNLREGTAVMDAMGIQERPQSVLNRFKEDPTSVQKGTLEAAVRRLGGEPVKGRKPQIAAQLERLISENLASSGAPIGPLKAPEGNFPTGLEPRPKIGGEPIERVSPEDVPFSGVAPREGVEGLTTLPRGSQLGLNTGPLGPRQPRPAPTEGFVPSPAPPNRMGVEPRPATEADRAAARNLPSQTQRQIELETAARIGRERPGIQGSGSGAPPNKTTAGGQGGFGGGFGPEWTPAVAEARRPFWSRVIDEVSAAISAPMGLVTTISPMLLRQGQVRLLLAPTKALDETFRSMWAARTEKSARAFDAALRDDPFAARISSKGKPSPFAGLTAEDVKLKVRDWGPNASAESRPVEFQGVKDTTVGRVTEKVPWYRYSNRQYATEFNAHILHDYGETARRMWDMEERLGLPHDRSQYEDLARKLEHRYQYGSMRQGKVPVFFSLPAMSGRAQAMGDVMAALTKPGEWFTPGATQEAMKTGIAAAAATTGMMYLVAEALPGFEVDTSRGIPRLKTPVGTIDPYAGWGSMARLIYDSAAIIEGGVSGKDSTQETWDKLVKRSADFLRGQSSPTASEVATAITHEDYAGRNVPLSEQFNPLKMAGRLTLPIVATSIKEGYDNYGAEGAVAAALWEGFSGSLNQGISPSEASRRKIAEEQKAGTLPKKYEAVGGEMDLTEYNQMTDLQKEEFDKRNPKIKAERERMAAEPIRRLKEEQAVANNKQDQRDTALDNGLLTPEQWREQRTAIQAERRGALDSVERQFPSYFKDLDQREVKPETPRQDVVMKHYIQAIKDAESETGVDWLAVDRYVAGLSKTDRDLLFDSRLAGSTSKEKEYLSDVKDLEPYWAVRDKDWADLQSRNPRFQGAKDPDDWRLKEIQRQTAAGKPPFVAEAIADALIEAHTATSSVNQFIFLIQHRELIPLLEKWGFGVPSELEPLSPNFKKQFEPVR